MKYFILVFLFSFKAFCLDFLIDDANLINSSRKNEIEQSLRQLRAEKDIFLVVWTIPSLNGQPIETVAVKQFEKWKIGNGKKDNGLLLLIAANDHKMRLEVGYGLEGDFPDVRAKHLLDEIIRPSLKNNDLASGVLGLIAKIKNQTLQKTETNNDEEAPPLAREEVLKYLSPQVIDLTNEVDGDTLNYFNNQIQWRLEEGVEFWIIVGPLAESHNAMKLVPTSEVPHRVVLFLDLTDRAATLINKPDFGSEKEWSTFTTGIDDRLKASVHPINALGGSNGEIRSMLEDEQYRAIEKNNSEKAKNIGAFVAMILALIVIILGRYFKRKISVLSELTLNSEATQNSKDLLQLYSQIYTFMLPLLFLGLIALLLIGPISFTEPIIVLTVMSGMASMAWVFSNRLTVARSLLAVAVTTHDREIIFKHFGDPRRQGNGDASTWSSSDSSSSSDWSSSSSSSSSDSSSDGGSSGGGGASSDW